MAKISPKKESDKPRHPFAVLGEKIRKDTGPVVKALENIDLGPHYAALVRFMDPNNYAEEKRPETEAQADEQKRPEIKQTVDSSQIVSPEEQHDTTDQVSEDLPQTFEELLQGITIDELTERLRAIKWISEGGKWIVRKNRTTVLFNVLRNKDLLQNGCVVKTTVPAIAKYFKLKKIAESYGRPLRERDYSDAQEIANEELNEVF
jgi:alpha-D-ribose 1-methylphosphonate 5-triphosphate synthase subunit PhnI